MPTTWKGKINTCFLWAWEIYKHALKEISILLLGLKEFAGLGNFSWPSVLKTRDVTSSVGKTPVIWVFLNECFCGFWEIQNWLLWRVLHHSGQRIWSPNCLGWCFYSPFSSLGEKISRADQTRPDKKLNSKLSHIIEILRKDNEIKDVVLK